MKPCPDCAEEIKEAARICRFCGWKARARRRRPRATPARKSSAWTAIPITAVVLVGLLGAFFALNPDARIEQLVEPSAEEVLEDLARRLAEAEARAMLKSTGQQDFGPNLERMTGRFMKWSRPLALELIRLKHDLLEEGYSSDEIAWVFDRNTGILLSLARAGALKPEDHHSYLELFKRSLDQARKQNH